MRVVFTSPDRAQAEHFADSLEKQGRRTEIVGTRSIAAPDRLWLVRVSDSDAECSAGST